MRYNKNVSADSKNFFFASLLPRYKTFIYVSDRNKWYGRKYQRCNNEDEQVNFLNEKILIVDFRNV